MDVLEEQAEVKVNGENDVAKLEEHTLHMTLEEAGHEAYDCMCEAVGSDKDSVTYQCKYEVRTSKDSSDQTQLRSRAARIEGKFAMNVP